MGEVMKSIDANDLIYTEDGRMIEKGTGRECALLSSGDICYADELSGGEEVVNSDNTISLSDSLNNDTLVSDMSYTGYSSDNESTHLEKESKIEEPESISDTSLLSLSASAIITARCSARFSGLSPEISLIISAYDFIIVSGVLRSCDTLAIKSR